MLCLHGYVVGYANEESLIIIEELLKTHPSLNDLNLVLLFTKPI